jgi:hypothetical protein
LKLVGVHLLLNGIGKEELVNNNARDVPRNSSAQRPINPEKTSFDCISDQQTVANPVPDLCIGRHSKNGHFSGIPSLWRVLGCPSTGSENTLCVLQQPSCTL